MSEVYFNEKQINRLKEIGADGYFHQAVYSRYKRATLSKMDEEIADMYDSVTGGKVNRNFSCGSCSYELYRKAGTLFFKSVEKLNNDKKNIDNGKEKKGNTETPTSAGTGRKGRRRNSL